jgi:F0F1-type ATP synthase assembly protein I
VNLRAIQEVNTGLASAFELIATPAIFGFLGHLLDEKLGTGALFMIGFALFVFGYECWKLVTRYNAQMARHEADAPWNRHKKLAAQAEEGERADAA